jgi:copper chaperone CopZ
MTERTLHVDGLTESSEEAIARILNAINGVDGVHTSTDTGEVRIELDEDVPDEMLRAALESTGLKVIDA